jgi:hypothetical protein
MRADMLKAVLDIIAGTLVGLVMFLGGGALLAYEITHPPVHTTHLFLWTSIGMLGALVLAKKQLVGAAKAGIAVAGPYLPFGRRAYDNKEPKP